MTLPYALTIHKGQGSEYPCVVIPIHTELYVMLQRNLVYTGITRGRKLVIVVGNKKGMAIAVKRAQSRGRITTLCERLLKARGVTKLPFVSLPLDGERSGSQRISDGTIHPDGASIAAERGTEYE